VKLYVVRHAPPVVVPEVPPERWRLSAQGVAATRALVGEHGWAGVAAIHHSPQPKTEETARIIAGLIGAPLGAEPDLAEVAMDAGFLGDQAFRDRVGAYLEGGDDPAFEPYAAALRRITAAVARLLAAAVGRDVAIVSHGRIITVLFSGLVGERLGRGAWASIGMPDVSVVDFELGRVTEGFLAGRHVRHPASVPHSPSPRRSR
jgi:broad specificity phosphatase PhoE